MSKPSQSAAMKQRWRDPISREQMLDKPAKAHSSPRLTNPRVQAEIQFRAQHTKRSKQQRQNSLNNSAILRVQ